MRKSIYRALGETSGTQTCAKVDMGDVYNRFASDVIASIAFGYECDSLRNPNNAFYSNSHLALPQHTFLDNFKLFLILNVPKVARFFRLKFYGIVGGNFFLDIMSNNVKERREKGIVRHDIINLLMAAENVNNVDITAQALLFFLAGIDTVSALLVYMSYELALRKDIQNRLQKEVDDALANCQGVITYDL
ncbi:hypothetical protein FQR65_LT01429 [Abscondita terminalis]|nr:hypothetical protein FQR65_LT01429 [Abscondita terminalis]